MPFSNSLVAGTALVRAAINSPNYVVGTSGWSINKDGTAEFNAVTMRGDLTSSNYVPGVSGYLLDYDTGSAEFNDADIRGRITIGDQNADYIMLGIEPGFGPVQFLGTSIPLETNPAFIWAATENVGTLTIPKLVVAGPEYNNAGAPVMVFHAPTNPTGYVGGPYPPPMNTVTGGIIMVERSFVTGGPSLMAFDPSFGILLRGGGAGFSTPNVLTPGALQIFQIGPGNATNMSMNSNQIQAANNGAAAGLYFNYGGGLIHMGNAASTFVQFSGNSLQAYNAGAVTTLLLNNAGGTVFCGGSLTAAINVTCDQVITTTGSTLNSQLQTNGGTVIGSAVVANGNLEGNLPTGSFTANANCSLVSGARYRVRVNTSSRRYKYNIKPDVEYTPEQILSLVPKSFQRNDERNSDDEIIGARADNPRYVGYIAEEAEELSLKHFVVRGGENKQIEGFAYAEFAAVAHQIVLRAQAKKIEALESRLAKLESIIAKLPGGLLK